MVLRNIRDAAEVTSHVRTVSYNDNIAVRTLGNDILDNFKAFWTMIVDENGSMRVTLHPAGRDERIENIWFFIQNANDTSWTGLRTRAEMRK